MIPSDSLKTLPILNSKLEFLVNLVCTEICIYVRFKCSLVMQCYAVYCQCYGIGDIINNQRTSDTLIGYLPIFQMLPKTSLCIRYHWYPFELDA